MHSEGIAQPTEPLLSVFLRLFSLVEQDAYPDTQQIDRVLLKVVWGSIRAYLPNGLPQQLSNLVASEVEHLALLSLVEWDGHVIGLIKLPSAEKKPCCATQRTYGGVCRISSKRDCLVFLVIYLYPPGDLY
jgi:hypothetical protein